MHGRRSAAAGSIQSNSVHFLLRGEGNLPFPGIACLALLVGVIYHGLPPLYNFKVPAYDMPTSAQKDAIFGAITA